MSSDTSFAVDVAGLRELEGGRPPWRLAFEPVANVFDEARGYGDADRQRPTFCAVSLNHQASPRGIMLTVQDDGPGFERIEDVWTLFGATAKRDSADVAGRFNAGDKQLLALARWARVRTGNATVVFEDGKRDVTRHRSQRFTGTTIEALMPWSQAQANEVRQTLRQVIPPQGLTLTVQDVAVDGAEPHAVVSVTLPTVLRTDGLMTPTTRKALVEVRQPLTDGEPWLYELGIPVCSLADSEFRWSLDVQQKVPVPLSRDSVTPAYVHRLLGSVIEAAAMDGVALLSSEDEGAAHIKRSLDWVREPDALAATVDAVFGPDAVRQSSDAKSNALAMLAGRTVINGRSLGADTRQRLDGIGRLPTTHAVFDDGAAGGGGGAEVSPQVRCPHCGESFAL